jgi:ABC-2 type transport system ATP-binding protein
VIELIGITKTYAKFTAVKNLNLTVRAGEVFGFIGPNGAGKTTTIKIIGGILKPTAGQAKICGIDIGIQPETAKKKIGFIPDRPYLYEKLTGMEFLKFTADLYGIGNNGFTDRASRELERFTIYDWRDELIESYSHGMRQRLIFAAALLHNPDVLVVDEPMVGLDPEAILMVKDLFLRLADKGKTVFMSTHTLAIAEKICHRIGIIHRGRLKATGTPEDLKRESGVSDADLEQTFLQLIRGA